jgi:hypothetical protein
MKPYIFLLFILICFYSCKKKSDDTPAVDYSCDCSKYGKNIITFSIDHPLSLYPANNDRGRYGFINSAGSIVINPSFKSLSWFSHDRAIAWMESNGQLRGGVIGTDGNFIKQATLPYVGNFFSKEGLIQVGNTFDIWAYMDINGTVKTPYDYSEALGFYEGRAVVDYNNLFGAIDENGTLAVPNKYLYLGIFSEGKAYAAGFNSWLGYIGPNNEQLINPIFSAAGIFVNGYAVVRDTVFYKFGFIDSNGNYLISPSFDDAGTFWEKLAAVKTGSKWGFVNTSGDMAIQPVFDDVLSGFCENLVGIKVGNEWGYADKTGQIVIQPQFKAIDVFYCGLAMVLFEDGHIGYIDKNNNTIWKSPILALKNTNGNIMHITDFRNTSMEKAVLPMKKN